jgi:hypothetical protein
MIVLKPKLTARALTKEQVFEIVADLVYRNSAHGLWLGDGFYVEWFDDKDSIEIEVDSSHGSHGPRTVLELIERFANYGYVEMENTNGR